MKRTQIIGPGGRVRHSNYLLQWHGIMRSRGWGRWIMLLPLFAIGGPVSLWAALEPRVGRAQFVIPLPPAQPEQARRAAPVMAPVASMAPVADSMPAPVRSVVAVATDMPEESAPGIEAASDAIDRALQAALRSGDMQDWAADDGRQGIVVVAPQVEHVGARTCRNATILMRDGTFEGKTSTGQYCIDGANRVTMLAGSMQP